MRSNTYFEVLTSTAKMPTSCWGYYSNVAIVEVDKDQFDEGQTKPRMISTHAKGIVSIVHYEGKLHHGGERSAFVLARKKAVELCGKLNTAKTLLQQHNVL